MCDDVAVPRPPAPEADRIAKAAHAYVRRHLEIHIPRIVERLRDLRRRGLTLHVASGDQHDGLVHYLDTVGAREIFDRAYGTDVLNVWKSSAAFYGAILADAGIDPTAAVVVDDSERAIDWAGECEMRGVLVRRRPGEPFEDSVLRAFDEVNALL